MAVYYNDNDPSVCLWLEELIRQGELPDGVVDNRSILDVRPEEVADFDQCHFFAGIGGWALAFRIAGIEGVSRAWSGSPPCQPFSIAGAKLGKEDERHLAPHFADLIEQVRPDVVFGEQVASSAVFGKVAARAGSEPEGEPEWAWLDDVSDRLEAAHYAFGATDIPAASVGSPQIRQRTFFTGAALDLADPERPRLQGRLGPERSFFESYRQARARGTTDNVADAAGGGREVAVLDGGIGRETDTLREASLSGGGGSDLFGNAVNGFWRGADWLSGRDGKWRPVEPGTFPVAHGVQESMVLLRGYGNAINPQAGAVFIRSSVEAFDETFRVGGGWDQDLDIAELV